jgi:ATP-dependent DNA helicase DinG
MKENPPPPVPTASASVLLGPGGPIAEAHGAYETRPQQLDMAAAVEEAIREKRHAVLEAGTGVGKSFAYLVPAVLHARAVRKPVLVCTSTISLQEQLVLKDLPFLEKALKAPFTYALLKGRANFLCLRRLGQAIVGSGDLFERAEEFEALESIARWARSTSDGSRSDLETEPPFSVWDKVCCETGNCIGKKCGDYRGCFFNAARRRAHKADLLVVNYALYFADLAMRQEKGRYLPEHQVVVFDEAHEVESIAAEHLGDEVTFFQVKYLLDGLLNPSERKGFLLMIGARGPALAAVRSARRAAEEFFDGVVAWSETRAPENRRIREKAFVPDPLSPALKELGTTLADTCLGLCDTEGIAAEFNSHLVKAHALAEAVDDIVLQKSPGRVAWAEIGRSAGRLPRVKLKSCPIDVAPVLRELLFKPLESVLCTSATLATAREGGFEYFRRAVGMPDGAVERRVDSPFDYQKQATLVLCPKMPEPNDRERFVPPAAAAIVKYVRATSGRAFVLFTSYDLMKTLRDRLAPVLAEWDIRILLQGEGTSRHRMLQEFKAADGEGLALFGVDSFWQGVDVPGRALSTVILTKLPFPVPSHPYVEAKQELIREEGGEPFEEYFLPEAILKLKQGFGRLIRRKDDRGTVVLLDPRVVTKGYGRRFLAALPQCRMVHEGTGLDAGRADRPTST